MWVFTNSTPLLQQHRTGAIAVRMFEPTFPVSGNTSNIVQSIFYRGNAIGPEINTTCDHLVHEKRVGGFSECIDAGQGRVESGDGQRTRSCRAMRTLSGRVFGRVFLATF